MAFNPYKKFLELIPTDPLMYGEVLESYPTDSTVKVSLTGGQPIIVKGDMAVGKKVWVRAGAIESEAPDLPFFSVDIT